MLLFITECIFEHNVSLYRPVYAHPTVGTPRLLTMQQVSDIDTADARRIASTVKGFYRWYHNNYNSVNSFKLVPNAGKEGYQYRVDFIALEQYLNKLRSSGYLSRQFIEKERAYYLKCDRDMQDRHQCNGPPGGLEYDRILFTQEIEYEMSEVIKAAVVDISISENRASATVYRYTIELIREEGAWKILSIKP